MPSKTYVENVRLYKKQNIKISTRSYGINVIPNAFWKYHRSIRLEIWVGIPFRIANNGIIFRFLRQQTVWGIPKMTQLYKKMKID